MKKLFLIFTLLICSVTYGQRCVGNCANGQGTYYFSGGSTYVGSWRNGMRNGQGTYTFEDGEKYVGSFKDGDYHGQGTLTYANGQKYVGSWRADKRHGQGTMNYTNVTKYVGSWRDGKRNGQGTMTYANGDIKRGIWQNDTYIGTQAQVQAKERERIARENRERQVREEAKKKYDKIYNACLLDKSSGVDMQVNSLRRAVEETCKSVANDPSWYDELKYFKL